MKHIVRFFSGGVLYCWAETLFRAAVGHKPTHYTMFILGGGAFAAMLAIYEMKRPHIVLRWLISGGVCVAAEFVAGVILNVWLKLGIWDYSSSVGNLLGVIAPEWALIWLALTGLVFLAANYIYTGNPLKSKKPIS